MDLSQFIVSYKILIHIFVNSCDLYIMENTLLKGFEFTGKQCGLLSFAFDKLTQIKYNIDLHGNEDV